MTSRLSRLVTRSVIAILFIVAPAVAQQINPALGDALAKHRPIPGTDEAPWNRESAERLYTH
jgi:hypothetical protein